MADLFEGFKWREVIAIASLIGFAIMISVTRMNGFSDRLRRLEIRQAAMECAINPEICRAIMRGE